MAIYVTGDTHGNFRRFTKKKLNTLPFNLTANDFVIICGDFGLLWSNDKEFEYNIKWLSNLAFNILWIQGNHENYNMISEYKIEEWNGGLVRHIVRDKIILLERGQVFNLQGKVFYTFGGAESNDIDGGILNREDSNFKLKKRVLRKQGIQYRILNETWWKEELPGQVELDIGVINLNKVNWQVDYVITHCASNKVQEKLNISSNKKKLNILTDYFDILEDKLDFSKWYFGHYHNDIELDNKHELVYKEIKRIV